MFDSIKDGIYNYYKTQTNGCICEYNAFSMSDIYCILSNMYFNAFGNTPEKIGLPLWFRGQSYENYTLIPSIFRERDNKSNTSDFYSTISLAEEYRFHNFSARVNHLTVSQLDNKVEWQELLQHHVGKTRFMDWSESVKTAVSFALEAFIDTKNTIDNKRKRETVSPVIWVLNPYRLNEHVYDFFSNTEYGLELIKKSLLNIFDDKESKVIAHMMQNELITNKDIYFNIDKNHFRDISINGLVNICMLYNYYHDHYNGMGRMLKNYEFNPFFYLLVRFYADALPVTADVNKDLLPPLASIQPYHSERIRAQRGTFTIFPNYCRTERIRTLSGTKLDIIPIESQINISDSFCKIRLCDPVKITKELIYAGERRPEIYPDIEVYADYIETQKFFV